jgi:hypothetical protein
MLEQMLTDQLCFLQLELINELALRFGDDGNYKLLIVRPPSPPFTSAYSILRWADDRFSINPSPDQIDSIINLFRQDYSGRGELSERYALFLHFLR